MSTTTPRGGTAISDQLATPSMAFADRERSLRHAGLRNDLVPAR